MDKFSLCVITVIELDLWRNLPDRPAHAMDEFMAMEMHMMRILHPLFRAMLIILGGWQAGAVPQDLRRDIGMDETELPHSRGQAFWSCQRWFRGL
jgi:hypothetical protein